MYSSQKWVSLGSNSNSFPFHPNLKENAPLISLNPSPNNPVFSFHIATNMGMLTRPLSTPLQNTQEKLVSLKKNFFSKFLREEKN